MNLCRKHWRESLSGFHNQIEAEKTAAYLKKEKRVTLYPYRWMAFDKAEAVREFGIAIIDIRR
jgi:hypothetical protein